MSLAKQLRNNMTLSEVILWREIKGKTLDFKFSRQISIDQYIVDFYCKELQLAIEIDGSIHFEEGHHEKDSIRQKRLESLGVTVIRFSSLDIENNLGWVILEIEKVISDLQTHPQPLQGGEHSNS